MRRLQVEGEITKTAALIGLLSKSKGKRRLQAWHYLIPILITFWIVFAVVVMMNYLPFLVIGALAVLTLFSVLITGLAWAFQNDI